MSIKAVCHWGEAEDVCIVVENKDSVFVLSNEIQIPLTRQEARKLAAQLLEKAYACDQLERNLKEYK